MTAPGGLKRILLISRHREDVAFAEKLADFHGATLSRAADRDGVRHALALHPRTIVLWDADTTVGYEAIQEILPKYIHPRRVVALTQKPFGTYPHLVQYPVYRHHLLRRYDPAVTKFAARLVGVINAAAAGAAAAPAIGEFFPEGTAVKRLAIAQAAQKSAATEAIQSYLTKQGVRGRLAALAARAIDELVINAVHAHGPGDRSVEVELASTGAGNGNDGYMAACVTDQSGELKPVEVVRALGTERAGGGNSVDDEGLGLQGTYEAGLSLLFANEPEKRTRAMVFFKLAETFKDFRNGFRFLSLHFND